VSRCGPDGDLYRGRNADRHDATERRREKLQAQADRRASAAPWEDGQRPGGGSFSPRAVLRRALMRPTCVDSHHMEHPRHMAGA
jgi:hypothetical protein